MNQKKLNGAISFLILISLAIQPIATKAQSKRPLQEPATALLVSDRLVKHIEDNAMHLSITPDSLMGLRLDEVLKLVIENALENNNLHELPTSVLVCYEQLENGATSLNVQDLAEALPVVVEKLTHMLKMERAPRPDAPGNTDGAPVGSLLDCDFSEVLACIKRLTNIVLQCCATLQQDFFFTWTILADINASLTTCCAEIQVDFNGVFTSIAAIDMDFNSIFTAISDVKDTLTACCAAIEINFEGTFTTLTDIEDTLTACCAAIEVDFNGVFTSIAAIDIDLTGVFTSITAVEDTLTACCAAIEIDFNGVFTSIAAIDLDFNSIFTSITAVEDTLTACCAAIEVDFNGVFTSIAAIDLDFNSIFTSITEVRDTLTACCEAIEVNFEGTFTTLTDIEDTLTACCAAIQVDFDNVFTAITSVSSSFTFVVDIVDTLTACCEAIEINFESTFTVLTDIEDTLTACCAAIQVDFDGVFTSISDVKNTLTACCAAIEINFEGTFTVLATITPSLCNATPVTAPTIIASPGSYCLANDIVGTITIAASNVTFDINNHTISAPGGTGVVVTGVNNVLVTNGRIDTANLGVQLISNTRDVILSNLLITNCSDTGIELNPSCVVTIMQDIIIDTVGNFGINFINLNDNSQCIRVKLINFAGFFGIGSLGGSLSNCLFEDCQILNSASNSGFIAAFSLSAGGNNQLTRCSVNTLEIGAAGGTAIGYFIGTSNSSLDNCITQSIIGAPNCATIGYSLTAEHIAVDTCSVIDNESGSSTGFNLSGNNMSLNNCLVQTCSSFSSPAPGYFVSGSSVAIHNSQSYQVSGPGFTQAGTRSSFINCESSYNTGDGFSLQNLNSLVGNCTAFENGNNGFIVTVVGTAPVYGCFASRNGVADFINVPNVQNASTAAGVFARGNNFIP